MDDWAEIRHLHSTGKHSKREIARLVGVSRGTVDRAPTYQREPTGSSFDAFADRRLAEALRTSAYGACDECGGRRAA